MRVAVFRSSGRCLAEAVSLAAILGAASTVGAQEDLSSHQTAVAGTVRLSTGSGQHMGTGWLLEQPSRPVVLTSLHIANRVGASLLVHFEGGEGSAVAGRVVGVSTAIDLSVIALDGDPPEGVSGLRLETQELRRGEVVVMAGHPRPLPLQSVEGTVAGVTPSLVAPIGACGRGRRCVVVDAPSFIRLSGGPALNRSGRVVGMLWGGPAARRSTSAGPPPEWVRSPRFVYLVHAAEIRDELDRMRRR